MIPLARSIHLISYAIFFDLDKPCPGAISSPIDYDSYCLELVQDQKDKINADNTCRNNGGRLVEIESSDMQNVIRTEIESRKGSGLAAAYWWIGASVNTSKRYWEWTDGKNFANLYFCRLFHKKATTYVTLVLLNWVAQCKNGTRHIFEKIEIIRWKCSSLCLSLIEVTS